MPADAQRTRRIRLALSVLVAVSGPLVGLALWQGYVWTGVLVHGLGAAGAILVFRRPGEGGRMVALQGATLAACFPVVGAPLALLIFARDSQADDTLIDAYRDYINFEHTAPRWASSMRDPQAAILREVSVRPLADQLRHGDLASKQAAADALRRLEGGAGVPVLRQALTHPAEETRLLASLALVKLEEQLVSDLNVARTRMRKHEEDPHAMLEAAHAAQRYALSGLPTGRAAETLWRECAECAGRALMLTPSAPMTEAQRMRAQALFALDAPDEALAAITHVLVEMPDDVEAGLLRLELLYKLGRLDELQAAAFSLRERALPGGEAHEIASFWAPARTLA